MALCLAFVLHWVCLFVGWVTCACLFVSLCNLCLAGYVWHGVCLFVPLNKLCLAWGLSVCPCVKVMFGMGFVCLSMCTSYVWHGVCLFVRVYKLWFFIFFIFLLFFFK